MPIVVCDLYYPVGSFDEPPGKTGLAHFLEHMLFKGTERFPKGQIDHLAFIAGGVANAETGEDCTHFWFMFPSDRWELALQIEADRMSLARIEADEVDAERQVIGEERAREIGRPRSASSKRTRRSLTSNIPIATRFWAGQKTWRRIGDDDLCGPLLPRPLSSRRGGSGPGR